MPIYRFSESGTFSVLVEVRAENAEEARELIDDGEGKEIEGSLQYYDPDFELEEMKEKMTAKEILIELISARDHMLKVRELSWKERAEFELLHDGTLRSIRLIENMILFLEGRENKPF